MPPARPAAADPAASPIVAAQSSEVAALSAGDAALAYVVHPLERVTGWRARPGSRRPAISGACERASAIYPVGIDSTSPYVLATRPTG